MLVAAPGRFSTMNGCPVRSLSHWPIRRATMSLPPAGAYPTTHFTGRLGYPWADAMRDRARSAAAPVVRWRMSRREESTDHVPAAPRSAVPDRDRGSFAARAPIQWRVFSPLAKRRGAPDSMLRSLTKRTRKKPKLIEYVGSYP